jgi:hypothetical protein
MHLLKYLNRAALLKLKRMSKSNGRKSGMLRLISYMPATTTKRCYGLPCPAKMQGGRARTPMQSRLHVLPMMMTVTSLSPVTEKNTIHPTALDLLAQDDKDIDLDQGIVRQEVGREVEVGRQTDVVHGAIRVGDDHPLDRGPEAGEQMNPYAKLQAIFGGHVGGG